MNGFTISHGNQLTDGRPAGRTAMKSSETSGNGVPTVVSLLTAAAKGEPMVGCQSVLAIEGQGLADDRYSKGTGFYSGNADWDANVTLIQEESIIAVNEQHDVNFTPEMLRRNVVTRHTDLKRLIGQDFRIGTAVFHGTKEWPPCGYIAKLTGIREATTYFAKSCGIGASVLTTGEISVDDKIEVLNQ